MYSGKALGFASLALAMLVMSLPSGCALKLPDDFALKAYDGPEQPREQIAVIKTRFMEDYYGVAATQTSIAAIDFINLTDRWGASQGVHATKLLPGQYEIHLRRYSGMGCAGPSNLTGRQGVSLNALPGQTYIATSDYVQGKTYFWIEDQATGKIVAGEKPPKQ
jgi:hypothetical protein